MADSRAKYYIVGVARDAERFEGLSASSSVAEEAIERKRGRKKGEIVSIPLTKSPVARYHNRPPATVASSTPLCPDVQFSSSNIPLGRVFTHLTNGTRGKQAERST